MFHYKLLLYNEIAPNTPQIHARYIKFNSVAPYANGTPQYRIDSGAWLNMSVDAGGGWWLANPYGTVATTVGIHTLEFRDNDGTYNVGTFELQTEASSCISAQQLLFEKALDKVTVYANDGADEIAINGGAFEILSVSKSFSLSALSSTFTLQWSKTSVPCTTLVQTFGNSASPTVSTSSEIAEGQFGMKIPWQEHLPLAGVPNIFLDVSKPNNGHNLKASNYSEKHGYQLKIAIDAVIRKNGIDTTYRHKSQPIIVNDYGEEPATIDNWDSSSIEQFNSLGNSLGAGILLNGETTSIKITLVPTAAIDVANYYGIIRIQETNQSGYVIGESSTVDGIPPISLLTTSTKIDVAGNLVLECDTVPANLGQNPYTISAKTDLYSGAVETLSPEATAMLLVYATIGTALTGVERSSMIVYVDAEVLAGNHTLKDYETIYSLAGVNALVDYVGSKLAIAINAPTKSINGHGFDGATNYINSQFSFSTDLIKGSQNDLFVGSFNYLNNTTPSVTSLFGSLDSSNAGWIHIANDTGTSINIRVSNNTTMSADTVHTDYNNNKMYTISRKTSTHQQLFIDGAGGALLAKASLSPFSIQNNYIGSRNLNGTPSAFYKGTVSNHIIGASVGFNHGDYNTNLRTLLTSLGVVL